MDPDRVHRAAGWAGEPRRFGEGVAALAGDLAHIYADRLAGSLSPAAREIWHELRTEIIIGQYLDIRVAAERVADPGLPHWIAVCKSERYTVHRPLTLGAVIADLDVRGEVERRIGHLVEQAQAAIAAAPIDPAWQDELAGQSPASCVVTRE